MSYLAILVLMCSFLSTYSQDNSIQKAEKLIEDKKYESAYKLLNEADPDNQNPENCNHLKSPGNYYNEIYLKYPYGWFEPDSTVVQKFRKNYILACEKGVYDYWSLY